MLYLKNDKYTVDKAGYAAKNKTIKNAGLTNISPTRYLFHADLEVIRFFPMLKNFFPFLDDFSPVVKTGENWTCSGTLLPVEAFGSFTVLAVSRLTGCETCVF
jgi:hypothetical protein